MRKSQTRHTLLPSPRITYLSMALKSPSQGVMSSYYKSLANLGYTSDSPSLFTPGTSEFRHSQPLQPSSAHNKANQSTSAAYGRRHIRKGIFQHIQQQTPRLKNITFDLIDKTLLPEFFHSSSCKCLDTLQPCVDVMTFSKTDPQALKKQYQSFKKKRLSTALPLSQEAFDLLMGSVPSSFPEALRPQLESLVSLVQPSSDQIRALCNIVQHSKLEYLSYWLFVEVQRYWEIVKESEDNRSNTSYVVLVATLSQDLHSVCVREREYVEATYTKFVRSLGASLVPTEKYIQFLTKLNLQGKGYPARVFYALLLYLKPEILVGGKRKLFFQDISVSCWTKVLEAATNSILDITP